MKRLYKTDRQDLFTRRPRALPQIRICRNGRRVGEEGQNPHVSNRFPPPPPSLPISHQQVEKRPLDGVFDHDAHGHRNVEGRGTGLGPLQALRYLNEVVDKAGY